MSIFKDVTKTIKNIFSPEDDMMFDDENDFEVENQNPFLKKGNDKNLHLVESQPLKEKYASQEKGIEAIVSMSVMFWIM